MAKQKQKKNSVQFLAVVEGNTSATRELQNTGSTTTAVAPATKKKGGGLTRDLGSRAPAKQQINFIRKETKSVDIGKRIVSIVLVAALLLVAAGYAVYRWYTVAGYSREKAQLKEELNTMKILSAPYDEIYAEYVRYATGYESTDEHKTYDSRVLLDKARELIEPYGYITEIVMNGNTMKVTVYSDDISEVTDSLNNDPDGLVTMVIPIKEQKDSEPVGSPQAPANEQGGAAPSEEPEETKSPNSDEVPSKVLIESMAQFQLVFADKEG